MGTLTSALASYRGFDTFGEVVVIFTAGVAVWALLMVNVQRRKNTEIDDANNSTHEQHFIVRFVAKMLIPFILLFALYVQFHGDYGPGGGFQAGVIIAAAFILHALVFGLQAGRQIISSRVNLWMMVLGVTIYGAVGIVSMAKGGLFLDYTALTGSVGSGQHIGILVVEFGVGLTVTSVMLALFHAFASFVEDRDK